MAKRAAKGRASNSRRPKLKLIKNPKAVGHTSSKAKRTHIHEVVKGESTPYQQEALIIKYRLKARKLGRSILRRWHSRLDIDEVDSIVDLSLCEAVKRFDPLKGRKLYDLPLLSSEGKFSESSGRSGIINSDSKCDSRTFRVRI